VRRRDLRGVFFCRASSFCLPAVHRNVHCQSSAEPSDPQTAHRAHPSLGPAQPVQAIIFVAKGAIEEGMLSVLRSSALSAGILNGGSGEISLGGLRLSRFIKDVENVTGSIGESKAVTPAEEMTNIITADAAQLAEDADVETNVGTSETALARTDGVEAPLRDVEGDPRQALAQIGAQFVAALIAVNNPDAPA
jgi:hypothetical protein